jgi:hypothetical protein
LVARPSVEPTDEFAPGFRLSTTDAVVLVSGAIAAVALAAIVPWWGLTIAFVVGHFFLFCNVVRMARPLELAWAGVFLALAAATIALEAPGWPLTTSISLVATAVVVAIQMRRPSYHGVGWQRINPGLRAWFEARLLDAAGADANNDPQTKEGRQWISRGSTTRR